MDRLIKSKPAKARGKSVIENLLGDYTGEIQKSKERIEAEIKFEYIKLENDIKSNILNINKLLLGHEKFLWQSCGILAVDVVVDKSLDMKFQNNQMNKTRKGYRIIGNGSRSVSKTNSAVITGTERENNDHRRKVIENQITKEAITRKVSLKNKGNITLSRSKFQSKLGLESRSKIPPLPVIAPFVQAGEGYTCGLWLLLHFITGLIHAVINNLMRHFKYFICDLIV